MTTTLTNCDRSQQSTAGQEEDGSGCDLERKGGADSELSKATNITNLLEDLSLAMTRRVPLVTT